MRDLKALFLDVPLQNVIIVLNPVHVVALNLNLHVLTKMVLGTGIGVLVNIKVKEKVVEDPVPTLAHAHLAVNLT
jgi:hypothetical protein